MASEPNLFGEPQERPDLHPQMVIARVTSEIYPWDDIVCDVRVHSDNLDPNPFADSRIVLCEVVRWIEPPPWDDPEWSDNSRTHFPVDFVADTIEVLDL